MAFAPLGRLSVDCRSLYARPGPDAISALTDERLGGVIVTNHVLAGALIGRALARHPVGAFAAGVMSHLAMDACPHWGPGNDPEGRRDFLRVAKCDGCAGLAAMAVSAGLAPGDTRKAVVAGMLGGAMVDADKPCEYFFGWNPFPQWFQNLHGGIQNEAPDRLKREVATVGVLATVLAASLVYSHRR